MVIGNIRYAIREGEAMILQDDIGVLIDGAFRTFSNNKNQTIQFEDLYSFTRFRGNPVDCICGHEPDVLPDTTTNVEFFYLYCNNNKCDISKQDAIYQRGWTNTVQSWNDMIMRIKNEIEQENQEEEKALFNNKQSIDGFSIVGILREMGEVHEPWGLYEPYLWRDKVSDDLWHCELQTVNGSIWQGKGNTVEEAVIQCYRRALKAYCDLLGSNL